MKEDRKGAQGVELFLDNRQVFMLFFAGAVVLSLVFTLGVVVGKRVEGKAAPAPTTDPLTLLDQMGGNQVDDNLTFHEALTGGKPEKDKTAAADAGKPGPVQGSEPDQADPQHKDRGAAKAAAALARKQAKEEPPTRPARAKASRPAPDKKTPGRAVAKRAEAQPEQQDADESGDKPAYTLQLSSFQDRNEAEGFMQKLRDGGMKPYMIPTTIPGRGVWYRVRLGDYTSWDEALAAKQLFERQQKIIAYVAKK